MMVGKILASTELRAIEVQGMNDEAAKKINNNLVDAKQRSNFGTVHPAFVIYNKAELRQCAHASISPNANSSYSRGLWCVTTTIHQISLTSLTYPWSTTIARQIASNNIYKKPPDRCHNLPLQDEDKCGHEALGAARLHLSRLSPGQTSYFNVFLEKPYADEVSEEETGPGRGRILISLCYATRRRALLVGVQRCAGLLPMDSNGTSDPFVKLQFKNDPQRRKFKTVIKWRNLNPEFNEEFAFEVKMGDLSRRALLISVWDKDLGKANDYLGGLELGFCSKGDRLKHWLDAIKFPDRRHERWHNLIALPRTD